MGEVPPLTRLYREYQAKGFQFFIVYSREAHPGENYPHHESFEQKVAQAKKLRELEKVNEIPILVDDFQGTTHYAYGLLQMTLHDGSYDYRWISADGQPTFEDSGTVACN